LDSGVCFVVGGLKLAVWLVVFVGLVVEAAVGQRTTDLLMEEKEEERDLDALFGGGLRVTPAIALESPMSQTGRNR